MFRVFQNNKGLRINSIWLSLSCWRALPPSSILEIQFDISLVSDDGSCVMNAKQFSDDLRGDIESLLSNSLENHELGPKIKLESESE